MTEYKKVFVDTAPFIYFLDDVPNFAEQAKRIFSDCITNNIELITSVITIEEYLIYPYRQKDIVKIDYFSAFLQDYFNVIQVNSAIAKNAAMIRAKYKEIKGMDALQLACSIFNDCDLFITNDKQLIKITEGKCILLNEWNLSN